MGTTHTRDVGTQKVEVPSYLQPLFEGTAGQIEQAQGTLPTASELYKQFPQLSVSGLTGDENSLIQQLVNRGGGGADFRNSEAQLAQLTGGPIGSSPATAAGMEAFQNLIAPQISQNAVLAGQGNSGALVEQLQRGATSAALPLIQQEIANREGAVGQYAALDQLQGQDAGQALKAAEMPRETSDAQNKALYDQLMAQLQYAEQIQLGPSNIFSALLGQSHRGIQNSESIFAG